jgi:hypothetical protein
MDTPNTDRGNTFAPDVYAFAMVCYEVSRITSHQEIHLNTALDVFWDTPFHDIANDFRVILAVQQGKRPSLPMHNLSRAHGWCDKILYLVRACWANQASGRPSAHKIVEKLRALPDQPVDTSVPIPGFAESSILHAHEWNVALGQFVGVVVVHLG